MLFASLFAVSFAAGQKQTENYARGEILVKFKNGVTDESISTLNDRFRGKTIETLGDLGWQRIAIPKNADVDAFVRRYQALDSVESAQPNFFYSLQATPNDPGFPNSGMYGLTKISAPQAWDIATGSNAVVIANIDTGSRYTHEDLAANMWVNPGETAGNNIDDDGNGFIDDIYGYDFFFNDADPLDEHGHGTHTAGTVGAVGNNGLGVVGVNWNVKIMTIKIYDNDGFGTTAAMLINAYNYIRMMKDRGINIRVTNNSYGGCDEACGYDQATKDALDAMGDAGILNVFAAGNDARNTDVNPAFPASYTSPSILSVANSNSTDTRNGSSNFGIVTVDLAAPGTSILSTTRASNSSYGPLTGTSMASPHVAGAAALLAGHNPSLSPASLKATLMNTVDQLPQWSGLVKSGGRLNVFSALQNQTVCSIGLASEILDIHTKGGLVEVNATAAANCDYGIKSNVNWIHVRSENVGSANSTIRLWIRVNPMMSRTGTVRIGDRLITIRQRRPGNL